MKLKINVLVIVFTFAFLSVANAQDEPLPTPDDGSIFTLSWENDFFSDKDDGYTNGVRASFLSAENNIPVWLDNTIDALPLFPETGNKRWHAEIGQSMFTPSDITIASLQKNDRPYAGWTYGGLGVVSDTGSSLDNLQLAIGVVGPSSGAETAQKLFHKAINDDDPKGWQHQLRNEVGVVLTYEHKWRGLYEFSPFGLGVDITPAVGASVGNIYTNAAVGAVMRIGYDLPSDYGPPLIRPNLPGSDFFKPHKNFGWYAFAGFEGRAVARNIFLDGNTFKDSHSVDKFPLVGGIQGGAVLTFYDTRLAYTHVFRTKEFHGQEENEMFGGVTLSHRF